MLLFVSTVNATDIIEVDNDTTDIIEIDNNTDVNLAVSPSNLLSSSNDRTYDITNENDWQMVWDRYIHTIGSGTVTLNIFADLDISELVDYDKYKLEDGKVTLTLIINGNGHMIHSDNDYRFHPSGLFGRKEARFLEIKKDNSVILNDLILDGFGLKTFNAKHGGLIYMSDNGHLEMNNCFVQFNDLGAEGMGAIALMGDGNYLKMTNTTITASYIWGDSSRAGAIYINKAKSKAELYDCTFSDIGTEDKCARSGGAIWVQGTLYAENCNFSNCMADYGGALYINQNDANVKLVGCIFENNQAKNEAVIDHDGEVNVYFDKCSFINNQAKNKYVLFVEQHPAGLYLTNCVFYYDDSDSYEAYYVTNAKNNNDVTLSITNGFSYNFCGPSFISTAGDKVKKSENWISLDIKGENQNIYVGDTVTYTLCYNINEEMAYCPALPVKIVNNGNEEIIYVEPKSGITTGDFDITFENTNTYKIYSYDIHGDKWTLEKTINPLEPTITFKTNLKENVTNNFDNEVIISIDLYYNDDESKPLANTNISYNLDGVNYTAGTTDSQGHLDFTLEELLGDYTISFYINESGNLTSVSANYSIHVQRDTQIVNVTVLNPNNEFKIKGKIVDYYNKTLGITDIIYIYVLNLTSGKQLLVGNVTFNSTTGNFEYTASNVKLENTVIFLSLKFNGKDNYNPTFNELFLNFTGYKSELIVPELITGDWNSEIEFPIYLISNGKTYNLTSGKWLFTSEEWYLKYINGNCSFDEIHWFNETNLTPVGFDYNNGINLTPNGINGYLSSAIVPKAGIWYAAFMTLPYEDYQGAIAFSCLDLLTDLPNFNITIIGPKDIHYGDEINFNITIGNKTMYPKPTGNISVYIDGSLVDTINLNATVEFNPEIKVGPVLNLNAGNHSIAINYSGDIYYKPTYKQTTINIQPADLNLNVNIDPSIQFGSDIKVNVDIPIDFNGNIQITVYDSKGKQVKNITTSDINSTYDLGPLDVGNYTIVVNTFNDTNYKNTNVTLKVAIVKADTQISLNIPKYLRIGNDFTVDFLVLPTAATGTVTITVRDSRNVVIFSKDYDVKDNIIVLDGSIISSKGSYKITALYHGDSRYNEVSTSENLLAVDKEVTEITANISNSCSDEKVILEFEVLVINSLETKATNGTVTINLYDEEGNLVLVKTVDVLDSKVDLGYLNAGIYIVNLTYNGDSKYLSCENSYEFTVRKHESITIADVLCDSRGNPISISVHIFPEDATGTYTVLINNQVYGEYDVSVKDVTLTNLTSGDYKIVVRYSGDYKYYSSGFKTDMTVKSGSNIVIDVDYNELEKVGTISVVVMPTDASGDYLLIVDGKVIGKYPAAINKHKVSMDRGQHTITAVYTGDYKYKASFKTIMFSTSSIAITPIMEPFIKYYGNPEPYAVLVTYDGIPMPKQVVTFNILGIEYTRVTNDEGIAYLNINLGPDSYNIAVSCNNYTINDTITIISTVTGDNVVKYYLNDTRYYATYYDSEGNPLSGASVYFNINGVFYYKTTDINGVASLAINLYPGDYIITTRNPGTGQLYSNKVTVLHTVINDDMVMTYRDGSKFTSKVVDAVGNPVSGVLLMYNINGVFYYKTTDENGTASLTINLNPGKYIITVHNMDNGEGVSRNITVLPNLVGEDVVMTYGDGSQYKCMLVNNVREPVANATIIMNINGVFYSRITDSDGIAALNINLLPGEYIITASYKDSLTSNTIKIGF